MSSSRAASRLLASALVIGLALALPASAGAGGWKPRIHALWADQERGDAVCRMYAVRRLPPVLRGSTTGRGCIVRAIVAAREGNPGLASSWLQAGYCKNPVVRKEIQRAGDAAVDYVLERYGAQVQ